MLEVISKPDDLANLSLTELDDLASEIRNFLVQHVSKTGGHLGPNLGVVELTIALHRVFESPKDTLVFDTGHQAYVHKILTGRQDFSHLRKDGGLSGYPSRRESQHDVLENSHASTALSWADGVAKAKHLIGNDDQFVVAVVGDGALTGGMAWEALNNIAESELPIIIVVNDNGRSYAPTHGGLAHHFDTLRTTQGYEQFMRWGRRTLINSGQPGRDAYRALRRLKRGIKDVVAPQGLFEDLGIKYVGPINGHNIGEVEEALYKAKSLGRPVIVHTITEKGHGYRPAEQHELDRFHNVGPIHPETGLPMIKSRWGWTSVFADELVNIGADHPEVVAITAAMLEPVGLSKFAEAFPERTFDVGIAEQHAAASAAGLAYMGLHPVVAIYATFLNRAFDQILMDVGLHNAGVTFVLDRAGVTGDDGASHNGIWDFTLLRMVPGVRIAAPRDEDTLRLALRQAIEVKDGPTVVRFPKGELPQPFPAIETRGEVDFLWESPCLSVEEEPSDFSKPVKPFRVLAVGYGAMIPATLAAAQQLQADDPSLAVDVVSTTWVWPVSPDLIGLTREYDLVVTVEDGLAAGGIGFGLEEAAAAQDIITPHVNLGVPTKFLPHATRDQVFHNLALDSEAIAAQVLEHAKKFKVEGMTEAEKITAEVEADAKADPTLDPMVEQGVDSADEPKVTKSPKANAKAIFFGEGSTGGSATELDVPTAPRRRTGAGLSGVQIEDNLERHDKLKMMRDGELGSIHSWELVTAVDGPGTRLTVFFNGCPLRCLYCHNPDTFEMRDGEPVTASELLKKIRRYVPVFKATKGGITLSGGEVLMQPAFAAKILHGAKEMGVHTAIDTSGYLGKSLTDDMMKDVDLVLLDVKSGHPETYKELTGRELEPTLEFGRRLAQAGLPGGADAETPPTIWLRFVVVPGYTDAEDNVEIIADYAAELQGIRPGVIERVEILPFHQMGRDKWKEIGIPYVLDDVDPPSKETVERVREQFRNKGLTVY